MMKVLPLIISFALFGVSSQKPKCLSKPAGEQDHPHGANEVIEIRGGTVRNIQGRISYQNGEPIEEAVVEVYDISGSDRDIDPYHFVQSAKRRAAYLTDADGHFCMTGLPSGMYLLRAGTNESEGWQEIYVRVRLERRWWARWWRRGKEINIELPPGT